MISVVYPSLSGLESIVGGGVGGGEGGKVGCFDGELVGYRDGDDVTFNASAQSDVFIVGLRVGEGVGRDKAVNQLDKSITRRLLGCCILALDDDAAVGK